MKLKRRHVVAAILGIAAAGTIAPIALAAPGTGLTPTTFVTATLDDAVRAHSDGIKLRTKEATDVRVQRLVLAAGARTGWHHHPGLVIVAVEAGAVSVMDSDCNTIIYGPGQPAGSAFTESGDEALQVTSPDGATVYATYLVPHAVPPVVRIEADAPSCFPTP